MLQSFWVCMPSSTYEGNEKIQVSKSFINSLSESDNWNT